MVDHLYFVYVLVIDNFGKWDMNHASWRLCVLSDIIDYSHQLAISSPPWKWLINEINILQ